MKRSISKRDYHHQQQQLDHGLTTMANCLKFLSGNGDQIFEYSNNSSLNSNSSSSSSSQISRVFECKTCNRQFQSFQALGGHRASHKKPRLMGLVGENNNQSHNIDGLGSSPGKPKTHECSICGLEFAIGQALGGHMRRHRASITDQNHQAPQLLLGLNVVSSKSSQLVPAVKKSTSDKTSKRVLFMDLNLTPLENDIKVLQLGNGVPFVDCFL